MDVRNFSRCGITLSGFFLFMFSLVILGCGGGGGGGGSASPVASDLTPTFQNVPDNALFLDTKAAIAKIRNRKLNNRDNAPWVAMHSVITFGLDMTVDLVETNTTMNAVEYLCSEARWQNQRIFRTVNGEPALPTRNISFGLTESFKVQDHVDQYLFAFSCGKVSPDQKITADDGAVYTVADMIKASLRNFRSTQELAKTIPALSYYYGIDKTFTNSEGVSYSMSDLMGLASLRDTTKETEAGTHHLYGMGFALKMHTDAGGKVEGGWQKAREYLDQHVVLAKQSQLAGGIFSMEKFGGWQEADSTSLQVWETGHMLEWLSKALTPEQMREGWVTAAAGRLAREILDNDLTSFSDGGMYHAANALQFYNAAVFP